MNYNYHFFKLDWPLASTLADDVLEITGAYMCQIVTDLISALDFE